MLIAVVIVVVLVWGVFGSIFFREQSDKLITAKSTSTMTHVLILIVGGPFIWLLFLIYIIKRKLKGRRI